MLREAKASVALDGETLFYRYGEWVKYVRLPSGKLIQIPLRYNDPLLTRDGHLDSHESS
jgi:hypothetical protein